MRGNRFGQYPGREKMIMENMIFPVAETIGEPTTLRTHIGMFNDKFVESDGVASSEQIYNFMISKFDEINQQTGYRFEKQFKELFLVYRNQILATLSKHYYDYGRPEAKIENEMLRELNEEIKAEIVREKIAKFDAEENEIEQYGWE